MCSATPSPDAKPGFFYFFFLFIFFGFFGFFRLAFFNFDIILKYYYKFYLNFNNIFLIIMYMI